MGGGVNRLRNNPFIPIYNGYSWFSIPSDFAEYIVKIRGEIVRCFSKTVASSEVFMQSVAMSSNFKDRVYGYDGKDDATNASKRLIDWSRGTPWVYRAYDYNFLMSNEKAFFARKFDASIDKEIIDLIYNEVKDKQDKGL